MDAHTHSHCKYYNFTKEFSVADLAAFHGHLGPYIVLGYRVGKYIREHFCDDPFQMKAEIHCAGCHPSPASWMGYSSGADAPSGNGISRSFHRRRSVAFSWLTEKR